MNNEEIDFDAEIEEDDDIYGAPGGFPLEGNDDDIFANDTEETPDME